MWRRLPVQAQRRSESIQDVPIAITAMNKAQLQARGMLPEIDGLKQFAPPLKMSGLDFAVRNPAPKVGADGTAILRAAGYADDEIERLRATGVI